MSVPSHLHEGDTLHVKVFGNGKPVGGIGIELAAGLDSGAPNKWDVSRPTYVFGVGASH